MAKHADIWHSFTPPEDLPRKLGILREHGEAVGRDVSGITISNELRDRSEADAQSLLEQGVTLFTLGVSGPDYDLEPVRRWLAWRDARNG